MVDADDSFITCFLSFFLPSFLHSFARARSLSSVAEEMQLDEVDGEWLLRLCWNVGVLHAKAEDYLSAMFGFRWSAVFAQRHESFRTDLFKAQFFFLTAKCCTDHSIDDADLERIVMCKELLQELTDGKAHYERLLALLEFQCLLGAGRWDRLDVLVRRLPVDIGFDRLAGESSAVPGV